MVISAAPMALPFLLLGILVDTDAFLIPPLRKNSIYLPRSPTTQLQSSLDYEYIPPNEGAPAPFSSNLESIYPPGTPSGLRGEAVRSALRSSRCLAWDLSATPLAMGWISVEGKGTMDFLNNKLSQSFDGKSSFQQACLLDAKGKVVDLISVASEGPESAFLLTSPGHQGSTLFERLDPLIFPMDQVTLTNEDDTRIFTLASTRIEHVQIAIQKYVEPLLKKTVPFPSEDNECTQLQLDSGATLMILPHAVLPKCACVGYTLIWRNDSTNIGQAVWQNLVGDQSPDGPIELGALEYETLRIEAGWPAFGKELVAFQKEDGLVAPSPLELHWDSYLDLEKGCYLGQEGVASVVKNPRGPPRLLYSVVFDNEGNIYNHQSEGDRSKVENLTFLPEQGQELFVLGSNEEISVGKLTSVAEPDATGEATIVGLALVRRADSILKQMKDRELDLSFQTTDESISTSDASGMISPPPLDPLDGLEVIVEGSFTMGRLQMVPSRKYASGQNMFQDIEVYESEEEGTVMGYLQRDRSAPQEPIPAEPVQEDEAEDLDKALEEAAKAEEEAAAAAAEAKRKAEKMEMLRRRAEEAMARRKKKASGQ